MNKYVYSIWGYVTVEAETEEEAREKADELLDSARCEDGIDIGLEEFQEQFSTIEEKE